ncbi:MAG: tetratricopeptide repeat protein [Chloroflexota bacterium]
MNEQATKKSGPLFSGDPFERIVGILIGLVTVLAGLVALLEFSASDEKGDATLLAQQYVIQAMSAKASGEIEVGYAWSDAYQRWLEWDTQSLFAELNEDFAGAVAYLRVREQARALSPLLQEPYFDPELDDFPNVRAYESDRYLVESTILLERFSATSLLAEAWDEKADNYVSQLLFYAVSLFLYGLSTTIVGRTKFIFVATGTFIAISATIWMIVNYRTPVEIFPDDAILAYSDGVGLAHQHEYSEAVQSFDQALSLAPEYADALFARANAYFAQGNLENAASDYAASIEAGQGTVAGLWNLGWTHYRLGDFESAISATQFAIDSDPSQIGLHFNLGIALLSSGDVERAKEVYAEGLQVATQQVVESRNMGAEPPSSLWWYLGGAAADLDALLACLVDQECERTPPYDRMADNGGVIDSIISATTAIQAELKNLSVALEYSDDLSNNLLAQSSDTQSRNDNRAVVDSPTFNIISLEEEDELGGLGGGLGGLAGLGGRGVMAQSNQGEEVDVNVVRTNTEAANDVTILFEYQGIEKGQLFVMKVFRNGREATDLRRVEIWEQGESGTAEFTLTEGRQFALASGNYSVEIYVDAQLLQKSNFVLDENQQLLSE